MKTLGIIAEYNPFHNGHAYQIAKARDFVNPDCVAVCMSGDFTQRGSAAILDKWTRAQLALGGGADLVVELPFVFACNRAPLFAKGGIDTLVSLGATHISFGCEADKPGRLLEIAARLDDETEKLSAMTHEYMQDGSSHAKAYEQAVHSVLGEDAALLMLQPNNILAIEYLKRIRHWGKQGVYVEAVPVRRIGSGYADANYKAGFAGATEIRRLLHEGSREYASGFVPVEVFADLPDSEALKNADDKMFQLIRAELIRRPAEELARIYFVGEGIENLFKKAVVKANSLDELVRMTTSRRYTSAAIRRMLVYILLGLEGSHMDALVSGNGGSYLRLLAANERGRICIREHKNRENGALFITNINKDGEGMDKLSADSIAIDMLAADMWNMIHGRDIYINSDKVVRPMIK